MKYESLIAGSFYHIYNRGNNREDIFIEERNYSYFIKSIEKYILKTSKVYAFCLLKNHFHLVVKIKDDIDETDISRSYSNLFNAYAKAINKAYNRTGSLFQDRFSRKKIDNEEYLKQLIIYVNTNAQHHNFIKDFRSYPFSSYFELENQNPKITDVDSIRLFDDFDNFKYVHLQKKIDIENQLKYLILE